MDNPFDVELVQAIYWALLGPDDDTWIDLEDFPTPHQTIVAVCSFSGSVGNGGLDCWFSSRDIRDTEIVAAAYARLKIEDVRAACFRVLSRFPKSIKVDSGKQLRTYLDSDAHEPCGRWSRLEAKVSKADETLNNVAANFIRQNPDHFERVHPVFGIDRMFQSIDARVSREGRGAISVPQSTLYYAWKFLVMTSLDGFIENPPILTEREPMNSAFKRLHLPSAVRLIGRILELDSKRDSAEKSDEVWKLADQLFSLKEPATKQIAAFCEKHSLEF